MKLRKIDRIYVYMTLAYIVLPLILLTAIHHIFLLDTISKMNQGYFGSYYSYFCLKNEDMTTKELIQEMKNSTALNNISFAITQEMKVQDMIVRGLYFEKEYVSFPMTEGRFLRPKDFELNNHVCVVGKDYQDLLIEKDGKKWIDLQGMNFEVVGILGYEESSSLDEYIYINLLSGLQFPSKIYLFDCTSYSCSKEGFDSFVQEKKCNEVIIDKISGGYRYEDYIVTNISRIKWFTLLTCCTLLSIAMITTQWVRKQKRTILIKQLLGASDNIIYKDIFLNFLGIFLLSFVVIYYICYHNYPMYLYILVKVYLIHLFFTILLSWGITKYLCTQSIAEEMNQ